MDFSSGMLLLVLLLQVLGHVRPCFLPHLHQGHYRVSSLEENAHSDPGTVHYSIPVPPRSIHRQYSVDSDIHTSLEELSIDTSKVFHGSVNFNNQERKIGISDLAFQHRFLDILYSIYNFSCNSGASTKSCVRLPIPPNVRNYLLNNTASVEEFKKYLECIGYVVDAKIARDLHHCFSNALNIPSRYQALLVSSLLKRNSILIVDKDTLAWNPGAVYLPSDIHKKVTETLLQSSDMNNCFNYLRRKLPDSNKESKYEVQNIKTSINETIFNRRNSSGSHKATTQTVTDRHFDTTIGYQDELELRSTTATKVPIIETTEYYQKAQAIGKESTPASNIETTAQYYETPVETIENTKKNVDESNKESILFTFEDEQHKLAIQPIRNEFHPPQASTNAYERYTVEEDMVSVTTIVDITKELNVDFHETAIGEDNEVTNKYPPHLLLDISTELYETHTEYKIITESTTEFSELSIETSTENSHASAEYSTSFGKTDREFTNVYEATTVILEHQDPRKTITTNDDLTVERTSELPEMMVYQDILHVSTAGNPTFPFETTTTLHELIQELQDIPYERDINHHTFSTEITDEPTIKEFLSTLHAANLEHNTFSVEATSVLPEVIEEFHATSTVPEVDHLSFSIETTIMPAVVKEFHSITREPGVEHHMSSVETPAISHRTKEFHNIVRKTSIEDSTETTTVLFERLKEIQYVLGEENVNNEKFSTETTTNLTDVTNIFNGIPQELASEHQNFTVEITTDLPEVKANHNTLHESDPENHTFSDQESIILAYDIEKSQSTPDILIMEYQTYSIDTTTIMPEVVKSLHNVEDEPSSDHYTVTTATTLDLLDNIAREPNLNNPTSLTEKNEKTTIFPEFTKKFQRTPQILEYQTSSIEAITLVPEIVNSMHSIVNEPSLNYDLASTEKTTDLPKMREFHSASNQPIRDNMISSVEKTTAIRSDVLKEFHTTPDVASIEYQTIAVETTTTHPQIMKSQYFMADNTNSEHASYTVETTTDLLEIMALRNIPRESNVNIPTLSIENSNTPPGIIQENQTPTEYQTEITTVVPEMIIENFAGESTMEQTMRSFDATPLSKIYKGFHNTPNGPSANHHIYSVETSTPLPPAKGYNEISYEPNQEHTMFSVDRVTVLPEIITEFANTQPISTVDNKMFMLESTLLPKRNDVQNIVHEPLMEHQTFYTEATTIFSEIKNVHNTAQENSGELHATIQYNGGQDGLFNFQSMPAEVITENHITSQGTIGTPTASIETFTESTQDYEENPLETLRELNKTLGEFVNDQNPVTTILENPSGEIKLSEHYQKYIDEVLSTETTTVDNVPDSSIGYSPINEEFTAIEFNGNTAETTTVYANDQLDEIVKVNNPYQKMLQILHPSQDISKKREFINVLDILSSDSATAKDSSTKSLNDNHFQTINENNDKLVPVINVPGDNIVFLDNLIPVYLNQMRDDFQTRLKDSNLFTMTKSNEHDSSYEVESKSDSYDNNLFSRLFNIYRNMTRNDSITTQRTEGTPAFDNFIQGSENYNYLNVPNLNLTDEKRSILSSGQKTSLSDTRGVDDHISNGINGNTTPAETTSISYRNSNSSEIQNLYLEDGSGFTDSSLLSKNHENSLDINGKVENGIVTEMFAESLITELNIDMATTTPFSNNVIRTIDTREDWNYEKDPTLNHDTVEETTIITERTMSPESTSKQENNNPSRNTIAYFEVIEDKMETYFVATGMTDKPETTTMENERNLQSIDIPREELDVISTTDPFVDVTSTEQGIQNQALGNESLRDVPDLQFLTTVLPSFTREENKIINFELTPDEHILMDKIYRHVMFRSDEGDITGNVEYSIVNNSTSSQDIVSLRSLVPMVVHYVNTESVSDEEIRILRDIFEELFENFKDQSEVDINFDAKLLHDSSNDRENLGGENNDQIQKKLDLNNTMKSLYENNVTSLDNWVYFKLWKEALSRNSTNINGNGKEKTILLNSSENKATLIEDNRNTEKAAEKELLRSKRMLDTNFPQYPDDQSTSGRNLFDILSQYGMYQHNKNGDLEKLSNSIDSLLGPIEENTNFSNFNKSTMNLLRNRILSDVGRSDRDKVNNNRIRRSSFPFNIVLTIPNKDTIEENYHKNCTESDTNDKYKIQSLHDANQVANSTNSRSSINILKNEDTSAVVRADITAQSVSLQSIGDPFQLKKSSTEKKSAFHKFLLGEQEDTGTSDIDKVKYDGQIPLLLPSKNIQFDPVSATDISTQGIVDDGHLDLHTEDYLYYDIDFGQYIYPGDVIYNENGTGEEDVNEDYDHVRNKRV